MKLVNVPSYIAVDVVNYIERVTTDDNFSEEVFNDWLFIKDVEHKNNPNAYIKSCFQKELDNGTFQPRAKVEYLPKTQVLINEMRDRGIAVLADDSVWLSVVWEHLVNFKEINLRELQVLNHKILEFMKTKEFSEYKELLMNSNTLKKYHINWKLIELKVDTKIKDWNSLLEDWKSEE